MFGVTVFPAMPGRPPDSDPKPCAGRPSAGPWLWPIPTVRPGQRPTRDRPPRRPRHLPRTEPGRGRAPHPGLHAAGQHADEDMRPDALPRVMVCRAHLHAGGLQAAESPLHTPRPSAGPHRFRAVGSGSTSAAVPPSWRPQYSLPPLWSPIRTGPNPNLMQLACPSVRFQVCSGLRMPVTTAYLIASLPASLTVFRFPSLPGQ